MEGGVFARLALLIPDTLKEFVRTDMPRKLNELEWRDPRPQIVGGGWVVHAAAVRRPADPITGQAAAPWPAENLLLHGAYYPNASVTAGLGKALALDGLARVERVAGWVVGRGAN